ncbi:MAG: hypothetical protein KDB27_10095 [Planctomycetales bacterium]|nr:hypothetical protein [Planctomycetales bacterium]
MLFPNRCRVVALLSLLHVFLTCQFARAIDFEQVQRLRRQGLYRAAERKCLDLLNTKLTDSDRALTLTEYLRTTEAHMSTMDAKERTSLIGDAEKVVDAYVRSHKGSPYGFLVSIQAAITKSANAKFARFDAEANLTNDRFDAAIALSRQAIKDFEALQKELEAASRNANSRTQNRSPFTQVQLQRLLQTVDWELARTWVNLAECFPDSKTDRITLLARATDLTEPLSRLTANPSIAAKAKLLDAECRRQLGQRPAARQLLTSLSSDSSLSPCVKLSVAIAHMELEMESQDLRAAQQHADAARSIRCNEKQTLAEFAYQTLRLYVQLAVETGKPSDVWQIRAAQQLETIGREFPGYWQRRAEVAFATLRGGSELAAELARLESQAARAYAEGSFDEAVALYTQAITSAKEKQLHDKVFEFQHRTGAVLHKQGKFSTAVNVLRDAAKQLPNHPAASSAHLLAIVDAAQLVGTGNAKSLAVYDSMLSEHLDRWPNSKTISQVAWWLGQLRQRQQQSQEALAAYDKIDAGFEEYAAVISAVLRCHETLVDAAEDVKQKPTQIENGVQHINSIAESLASNNEELERWARLHAIDLQLRHTAQTTSAEQQLLQLKKNATDLGDLRSANKATTLLVLAYVLQSRIQDAIELSGNLTEVEAEVIRNVMLRIDEAAPDRKRKQVAPLQLKLYALQDDDNVPDFVRGLFARCLCDAGEFDKAVEVLAAQLEKQPLSIPLQIELAATLEMANQPQKAIERWRQLAAGSRPATDEWFRAKLGIATNLLATNNAEEAADVIRVTKALHPALGGETLKQRFEIVLRKCEAQITN